MEENVENIENIEKVKKRNYCTNDKLVCYASGFLILAFGILAIVLLVTMKLDNKPNGNDTSVEPIKRYFIILFYFISFIFFLRTYIFLFIHQCSKE